MSNEKEFETILDKKIYRYTNDVNVSIYKEIQIMKEKYAGRGLLTSGPFVGAVADYITKQILESLKILIRGMKNIAVTRSNRTFLIFHI
jgi:hypothetical protein